MRLLLLLTFLATVLPSSAAYAQAALPADGARLGLVLEGLGSAEAWTPPPALPASLPARSYAAPPSAPLHPALQIGAGVLGYGLGAVVGGAVGLMVRGAFPALDPSFDGGFYTPGAPEAVGAVLFSALGATTALHRAGGRRGSWPKTLLATTAAQGALALLASGALRGEASAGGAGFVLLMPVATIGIGYSMSN